MAKNGKLLLLGIGFLLSIAFLFGIVECHRPHHPRAQTQTLSICDAEGESTEECVDKVPNKKPKFLLYKYADRKKGEYVAMAMDVKNITAANPHNGSVWKVLIHGFLNNAESMFPVNVRDAYVEKSKKTGIMYNILVVDWGELACASFKNVQDYVYDYAAKNTAIVGKLLGTFIVFMEKEGFLNLTADVHLIGFSLGAHVAGQAGRQVFDITGKTVRRITGLDPAGPAFWAWRYLPDFIIPQRRLQRKDTQFADIYHTSALFGSRHVMGDVDFWINDGKFQPDCVPSVAKWLPDILVKDYIQVCSHSFSTMLFAKSILDSSMHGCLCPAYRSYSWGSCACSDRAVVGEMLDNSTVTVGEFYYDPPRDNTVLNSMIPWDKFSLKDMIKSLSDMICK